MILLITSSPKAQDCATAITEATAERVLVAATLGKASTYLKADDFVAVVVDQQIQETDIEETERVLMHLGMATPVYMNLAISGIDRVVRELRIALRRREKEALIARAGAETKLRNELKDTVTALLLSCEIALQVPTLPSAAATKLRTVDELAREIRQKLGEGAMGA